MKRNTHTLLYESLSEKSAVLGLSFCLTAPIGAACHCRRDSDPALVRFAPESFEEFTERHRLRYCADFDAMIGDRCNQYVNTDRSRLYWFDDCCSVGGSYQQLVAVTTYPQIRLKTQAERDRDGHYVVSLRAHVDELSRAMV